MEKILNTDRGKLLVRPYQPEDEEGVLSLWRIAFEKEMDRSLWAWKYIEGPFKHQIAVCIDEAGQILVLYGGIPFPAVRQGDRVTITHLMDIMSHPSCRGSGLFVRVANSFFEFFAGAGKTVFYYGFPGPYHFAIGEKYLNYRWLGKGMGYLRASVKEVAGKGRRLGGHVEPIRKSEASMNETWRMQARHYGFSAIRDQAFIQWRFFDHPLRTYDVWGYRPTLGSCYQAYAVISMDGTRARLVDMLAPPSEGMIARFLGRLAIHYAKADMDVFEAWLPEGHFTKRALISAGFAPFNEPFGIIPTGRSFDPRLDYEWASTHLYYTMADGDLL